MYSLNMNSGEQVLEDSRHKLELLIFSSESTQDQLSINTKVNASPIESSLAILTIGPSANSLPVLLGLLAILRTSLARLYLNTLKLSVGPLGNLISLRFNVVVPSIKLLSARSSAASFADLLGSETIGTETRGVRFVAGGWEKTSRWVTPRGPDMETKSRSRLAFLSCRL